MITRLALTVSVISCAVILTAQPAEARKSKSKATPKLSLKVSKGKKTIGTEVLRVRVGETDEDGVKKFYFSTKSRLNDSGRSLGFRTHTVLNAKGKLITYDRWIDVKGATLRRRVFPFKGVWKHVTFAQQGRKNELIDLKITGPIIILDPRSPILVSMAVDRLIGKGETQFVNVETGKTGKLTMTAEHLVDGGGKRYIRYHLKGGKIAVSALRDDAGRTLQVVGLERYSGSNATLKPGALQPAAAPTAVAAPDAAATPVDKDAPIPPPAAAKPAPAAKPVGAPGKPAPKAADPKAIHPNTAVPKAAAPAKPTAAAKPAGATKSSGG